MTNYLTRSGGLPISAQLPLPVDDVSQATDRVTFSSESVTFNSAAAAASVGVNALDHAPILNLTGDKVGSFWGEAKNRMMEFTSRIGTLTETSGSASVVVTDITNILDTLFETTSGDRRYILKATDSASNTLFGWIGDITVSGNQYTIPVHDAVTGGTQAWKNSITSFDSTAVRRIEIFSYQSSFVWTTGTVLTREVALDEEMVERNLKEYFDSLSNGDFGINYRTGAIYFKKATTGTSDTCTYNSVATASVSITGTGASATLVDDAAFTPATSIVTPVGFIADDTATDPVDEGDVGAARMSLDRKQIMAGSYVDDAAFTPAGSNSYVMMMGAEADDTSPDPVDEGDAGALRMTTTRFLKVSQGDLISGEDQTNNAMQVVVKPLASSTYAPTVYTNVGSSTTANIKATAGNVFSLSCLNTNASVRYLLLFNSTGATTTVVYAFPVPASGGGIVIGNDFFTNAGHNFTTGITFGISTSATSYVAATASEHVTALSYI